MTIDDPKMNDLLRLAMKDSGIDEFHQPVLKEVSGTMFSSKFYSVIRILYKESYWACIITNNADNTKPLITYDIFSSLADAEAFSNKFSLSTGEFGDENDFLYPKENEEEVNA